MATITSNREILKLNTEESTSELTNNASEIYSKLQDYNQAYTNYVLCLEQHPSYTNGTTHIDRDASSNYLYNSSQCVQPDATQLMNRIERLQREMNRIVTTPGPDSDIPKKYNEVLNIRKEMDLKLRELYQLNTSIPVMYQQETDSTLYATLLWATLATCLIYYITML
jgi:hypothetical protein